jgi:tripartite-type tricarboxylate transporter receptor subunit TctC
VVQLGQGGNLLLVNNDLPVKSVKELVAYAKAHPGKLSYCSWGNGSGGHLAMESLMKQTGMQMTHVPYKGSAPCVQDLVGGQVQVAFADTSSTIPMIKAGKLRVLAHSGDKRYPQIPNVQSLNELGYPFTTYAWYGVLAPAKTPKPIVEQVNKAMNKVMADPAVLKRLYELNIVDLPPSTPEQFGATIARDLKSWGELIKSLNLPLQ